MSSSDGLVELRSFYEEEARQRLRTAFRDGERRAWREDYIGFLHEEGRSSVVDFGAGPGIDGEAFQAAGLRFAGIDLAHGNARLGRERGLHVLHGSVSSPPLRRHSFEAGWSMSTLMHLPADAIEPTVRAMAEVLIPGSPLRIGVWGSETLGSITSTLGIEGHQRPFHLRTVADNRALLEAGGSVEAEEVIDHLGGEAWNYQLFLIRTRGPARQ